MSAETSQEAIHWHQGVPPVTDEMVAVMCKYGWKAAWFDFSIDRWRDSKHMLLDDVTHWAAIRGPQ